MNKELLDSWFNFAFGAFIAFTVVGLATKITNHYQNIMVLEILVRIFGACAMIFLFSSFAIFGYKVHIKKKLEEENTNTE